VVVPVPDDGASRETVPGREAQTWLSEPNQSIQLQKISLINQLGLRNMGPLGRRSSSSRPGGKAGRCA
jgi:hypothetical protein